MQSLNKDNLFSIFDKGDEEIYKEYRVEDVLNNPYVLMGMVLEGVQNFELIDLLYRRNYPTQYKNVALAVKYKYYNKLYSYLETIDNTSFNTVYTVGDSFEYTKMFEALDKMRVYYEELEEYKKCSVVKSYLDLLYIG
jgi:hypothetical protein